MTTRTYCGKPRATDAGKELTVFGWVDRRRDHGGLIFIDLRDTSGILQVVVNPETAPQAHAAVHSVRLEYVLKVVGELRLRELANVNPKRDTGEVELHATHCEVLAVAKTPPFAVNDDSEADENLRLRYRFLDLRRQRLQHNLKQRARFIGAIRQGMTEQGFVEIETPLLIRATPEGARDYLVPSRLFPGAFYALPQSPQLYKQLCMVGGLDRYFQIAHCMRDEDLRADRQPEFTQLDLEMSFVDEGDVFATVEHTLSGAWKAAEFRGRLQAPYPRYTWQESMDRFGVDKPDVRFGMEIFDVTALAVKCNFQVFANAVKNGGVVKGIAVSGGEDLNRAVIEGALTDIAKAHKAKGLAYLWKKADGWQGSIAKFFSESELEELTAASAAKVGDLVLLLADRLSVVRAGLGALRNHLGKERHLYDPDEMAIVWVTDFPMFELNEDTGVISPAHHPFTQIRPEDLERLESDPLSVRSRAYDVVINGREIGSGSIRVTDPEMQQRIFSALGIDREEARRKFGFLLEAFEYGVPPHGGFAPGIDRLVMEGLGEENIRDVIAFPKNQQAQELLTGAPAPVDEQQLRDVHIQLRPAPAPANSAGR